MGSPRREVAVVQVVRLDPALDEGPHQGFECRRIVIDAAQQHGLTDQRNAAIGQPARRPRARSQNSSRG